MRREAGRHGGAEGATARRAAFGRRLWHLPTESDRGSVTAEFAIAVPVVLACVALCVAAVLGAAEHAALSGTAASAARLVARGDDPGLAGLPPGTAMTVEPEGSTTCVRLTASDGALAGIGIRLSARACALDEGHGP